MSTQPHNPDSMSPDVCPARYASFLVTRLRRLVHNPERILGGLLAEGQTALDIGCGPGYFTLAMAKLVGDRGYVVAADLQQEMLDIVQTRARKEGLESRIRLHLCEAGKIGLDEAVDFALAFYMVHEVPDAEAFLREAHGLLKPGGRLLVVEPKLHVSDQAFSRMLDTALAIGFRSVSTPRVLGSKSVLLERD